MSHTRSALDPALQELSRRFLKPDRSRLASLRALARTVDDVPALIAALGPEHLGPGWPDPRRWFHLSAREASALGPSRILTSSRRAEPALDRPPTLAAAVLYLSDPQGMVRAERAARALASRLWEALALPGDPPQDVAWRISGAGSTPSSYHQMHLPALREGPLAELVSRIPPSPVGEDPGWTGAFRQLASFAALLGRWTSGPDLLEPFLEIWQTGLGLWGVDEGHLSLFAPERHDAPASVRDIRRRRSQLDQLIRRCVSGPSTMYELRELLAHGADPDVGLQALALSGRPEEGVARLRALLEAGADPGRSDRWGASPLARLLSREPERGALLLEAGYPLEARDLQGRTALHQAVSPRLLPRLLEALLGLGAEVDAPDAAGLTPLHAALLSGQDQAIEPLLLAGADPHRTTHQGETVYHLAAAGIPAERLGPLIARFRDLGVRNAPDRHGWLPYVQRSGGPPPGLPPPSGSARPLRPERWEIGADLSADRILPEGLVGDLHRGARGAWPIAGDWLSEREDLRGQLISLGLAEEAGQAEAGRLALETRRHAHVLLAPFAGAHPLGARLGADPEVGLSFHRGLLWELALPARYGPGLPRLLETPVTCALWALRLTVSDAGILSGALPGRCPCQRLELTSLAGGGAIRLSPESFPALQSLGWRAAGAALSLRLPELRTLRVESPYQPDQPWDPPLAALEAPLLEDLQIVAGRAPREADPGLSWLLSLLEAPPPELRELELRPVSVELLDLLAGSRALGRLRSLTLSSVHPPLLEALEARAPAFAHLERLEIRALGMPRADRRWVRDRLARALPALNLVGIEYRKVGGY